MLENSKVILSKNIKVDREMKNVLSYTPTQLISLMTDNTHLVASDDHCSFIRERGTLQIDIDYSRVLGSNYMAYQNSDYSNKWFFCWIDEVIYKGNNNTEIVFTVDPFETFYSDLDFENAYVIREHVNDDTIGANTIPENIDTGDMIVKAQSELQEFSNSADWIAVETDAVPHEGSYAQEQPISSHYEFYSGLFQYNKVVSGKKLIFFTNVEDLAMFLKRLNRDELIDHVTNIFIFPSMLFSGITLGDGYAYDFPKPSNDYQPTEDERFYWYQLLDNITDVKTITKSLVKNHAFVSYVPRNNKCYCYPYNYLLVSNNVGATKIYRYEDFSGENCDFDIKGALTIGCSFRLIPKNYKGANVDYDETLPLAKFPTCSWSSDAYTNWLTEEGVNRVSSAVTSTVQGAMSGAMVGGANGALIGAGLTAVGETLGAIGAFDKAKLLPEITSGSSTGDVNWAMNGNNYMFKQMQCKTEYIRQVDDFFTRFGYKVNRLKTPNITGRRYFNYVQVGSSDDVASGSIPQKYMKEINDAFRKGITIWHDHNSIGNYSVSNTIV
jgi:hypothetical protein